MRLQHATMKRLMLMAWFTFLAQTGAQEVILVVCLCVYISVHVSLCPSVQDLDNSLLILHGKPLEPNINSYSLFFVSVIWVTATRAPAPAAWAPHSPPPAPGTGPWCRDRTGQPLHNDDAWHHDIMATWHNWHHDTWLNVTRRRPITNRSQINLIQPQTEAGTGREVTKCHW